MDFISRYQKLSLDFIREFKNKVNWTYILKYQKLSEDFIREFKDKVNWDWISQYQKLSEDFIREFKNKVNWTYILKYQKLSEDFIREFKDKVNWDWISQYQKLSEDFIREFKNKVNWTYILKYQKLSEDFIREFKDKVNWDWISQYQKLSEDFLKEFGLTKPKNNWLYVTNEEKREKVKEEYELDGDYIIAYKSTRKDGHSVFNFRYRYEVGKAYESHCDCDLSNDNSFGLSAWTKKGALGYYPKGKLFKVRIHLDDLGAMTSSGKLRASRIEILEEVI